MLRAQPSTQGTQSRNNPQLKHNCKPKNKPTTSRALSHDEDADICRPSSTPKPGCPKGRQPSTKAGAQAHEEADHPTNPEEPKSRLGCKLHQAQTTCVSVAVMALVPQLNVAEGSLSRESGTELPPCLRVVQRCSTCELQDAWMPSVRTAIPAVLKYQEFARDSDSLRIIWGWALQGFSGHTLGWVMARS